jgi:hypothetical protein
MTMTITTTAKTIITLSMIVALFACGDPKYHPPAIVVAFDPASPPPASVNTGSFAGIAAIVSNDTAGVTFSCTPDPQSGACGSFTPAQIASQVPTCYQAPATIPANNTVTVTATSITDSSKFVSATVTIVAGPPGPSCL